MLFRSHEVHGSYVFVKHGKSKNTGFVLSSDLSKVVVGQDDIRFVKFNKVEDIHGGMGISISNEKINVKYNPAIFSITSESNELDITPGSIGNARLTNSDISLGGVNISLGGDNPTPAFDLIDASNYQTSRLVGLVRGNQINLNNSIFKNDTDKLDIQTGGISNELLKYSQITLGGVAITLGVSYDTPAFDLSNAINYPAHSLSGLIDGYQINPTTDISINTITLNAIDVSTIHVSGDVSGLTASMVGLGNVTNISYGEIKSEIFDELNFTNTNNNRQFNSINLTSSHINSTLIGNINPSDAKFTEVQADNIILNNGPTLDGHAATKLYVDNNSRGLAIKEHVKFATTSDISNHMYGGVIKNLFQIDQTDISSGDRILVKDQINKWENGVYVANQDTNGWTRAVDFDSSSNMVFGSYFFVDGGYDNINTSWVLTDISNIIFDGSTIGGEVNFSKFSATNNLHVADNGGLYKEAHLIGIGQESVTNDMLAGSIHGSKIDSTSDILINSLNATGRIHTTGNIVADGYMYAKLHCYFPIGHITTGLIDEITSHNINNLVDITTASLNVTNNITASTMTGLSSLYSQEIDSSSILNSGQIDTGSIVVNNTISATKIGRAHV